MIKANQWSFIFKIAAIWNLSGALLPLFFRDLFSKLFYGDVSILSDGAIEPLLNHYLLWSFIFVMGLGYWVVSADLTKNRGILFIGILGKLTASITWIITFFSGKGAIMLLLGGLGDLFWAILFIYFLNSFAKKS